MNEQCPADIGPNKQMWLKDVLGCLTLRLKNVPLLTDFVVARLSNDIKKRLCRHKVLVNLYLYLTNNIKMSPN